MGEFDPHEGEAQTIVSLAEAAMHMYRAAIDSLPFPEDKKFQKRAEVVLTGMRKLRTALTEAASHGRSTPTVMMALSDVPATLRRSNGARRIRARIDSRTTALHGTRLRQAVGSRGGPWGWTAAGAARRARVRRDALRSGDTAGPTADLRDTHGGRARRPATPAAAAAEENLNGWDEALAVNGAGDEANAAAHSQVSPNG